MYTFINYVFIVTCVYTRSVSLLEPPSLRMYTALLLAHKYTH